MEVTRSRNDPPGINMTDVDTVGLDAVAISLPDDSSVVVIEIGVCAALTKREDALVTLVRIDAAVTVRDEGAFIVCNLVTGVAVTIIDVSVVNGVSGVIVDICMTGTFEVESDVKAAVVNMSDDDPVSEAEVRVTLTNDASMVVGNVRVGAAIAIVNVAAVVEAAVKTIVLFLLLLMMYQCLKLK